MTDVSKDLMLALKSMGYTKAEAGQRAEMAVKAMGANTELATLIKVALNPTLAEASTDAPPADTDETPLEPITDGALGVQEPAQEPKRALARPRPPPRKHQQASGQFHWWYFLTTGLWLVPIVLLLRGLLYLIETTFKSDTKAEPTFKALIGFW
jgi:hypothetical protein